MNLRFLQLVIIGLVMILLSAACASNSNPLPADQQATNIAMGVALAWTRTAEAPTVTPSATPTHTPFPSTATPTKGPIKPPTVVNFASCWWGPGNAYHLESNIEAGEQVQLVGVGSIPGWYIIINPYFQQKCWIQAANLSIDPNMDLSQYALMTPIPLRTPNP
jgi:uncharacterized protein YgiM (DUF1202 family)